MNKAKLMIPVAFLAANQQSSAAAGKDKRPNIIVILADDLGYSDLGCYGGEIQTPNLNYLAETGLRFTRFYNTSRSCPTRASLLTGLYQHQAGIGRMTFDAGENFPGYRGTLSRNAVTIAEVLKEAGYTTSMVGKWHIAETPLREDQEDWLNHKVFHETFSDLCHYPINRGFDSHYGTIYGVVDYFDPFSLVEGEEPVKEVGEGYYITQALSDRAEKEIRQYAKDDKPFFMYLAYTSPHWPLHALPEDIEKYKDTYTGGWEQIRNARYERQQEMGLFGDQTDFLTARQFNDRWEDNETAEWDARAMAVHAAMVDRMDQGIGQVIRALRETGQLDNTLILFMSDNGCSPEECQNMKPGDNDRPSLTREGEAMVYPKNKEKLPGPETTYAALGARWANVANTPFRFWKAKSYEGGICTPMIAHWPKGMKKGSAGSVTTEQGHVMDIMATCVELAGATYPETFKGHSVIPMEGLSLVPVFKTGTREGHEYLGFEHFTERAFISRDGWKIVRPGDKAEWELYNMNEDRTEKHNLAKTNPAKLDEMVKAYNEWAGRCMVEPYPGQMKAQKKN
ncbi:MAG: arylsulfatase [Bacteroidales bacterium]|nr:arylsulfatase [Bacteroidales bacterium]